MRLSSPPSILLTPLGTTPPGFKAPLRKKISAGLRTVKSSPPLFTLNLLPASILNHFSKCASATSCSLSIAVSMVCKNFPFLAPIASKARSIIVGVIIAPITSSPKLPDKPLCATIDCAAELRASGE